MQHTTMTIDALNVEIYDDRAALGAAAAQRVAAWMRQLLTTQPQVTMIFAAAPSQHEFLDALCQIESLDWQRVIAMHMDEYIGLALDDPRAFSHFVWERLCSIVQPGTVHYLDGAADPEQERQRYAALLRQHPVDIVCAGIGENGHLAFNDPPLADFDDPELVRIVELAQRSREQQVHDGCFARLEDVPTRALTLTIPALMQARYVSCVVPGPSKARAVARTLHGAIDAGCPATILRRHPHAVLAVDMHAAMDL